MNEEIENMANELFNSVWFKISELLDEWFFTKVLKLDKEKWHMLDYTKIREEYTIIIERKWNDTIYTAFKIWVKKPISQLEIKFNNL